MHLRAPGMLLSCGRMTPDSPTHWQPTRQVARQKQYSSLVIALGYQYISTSNKSTQQLYAYQWMNCETMIDYLISSIRIRHGRLLFFFSLFVLMRLLFEDGVYFVGKPGGQQRQLKQVYMWVIKLSLIDAGSGSTDSLSVLAAVSRGNKSQNTNSPRDSSVSVGSINFYQYIRSCPAYTSRGNYSRVATIRGWQLFEGGYYSRAVSNQIWYSCCYMGCKITVLQMFLWQLDPVPSLLNWSVARETRFGCEPQPYGALSTIGAT